MSGRASKRSKSSKPGEVSKPAKLSVPIDIFVGVKGVAIKKCSRDIGKVEKVLACVSRDGTLYHRVKASGIRE